MPAHPRVPGGTSLLRRRNLQLGWAHAPNHEWSAVLQANLSQRGHDSVESAEPTLSGSTTLSLSPGVSVALGTAAPNRTSGPAAGLTSSKLPD
jgi:hypothetical protein